MAKDRQTSREVVIGLEEAKDRQTSREVAIG